MSVYYTDDQVTLHHGRDTDVLRTLPGGSVNCVVTSPPYFGLRDYGVDGQRGLEASPAEYVAGLVEVFAEVRRVLADDGTCWLNLGDSYAVNGRFTYNNSPNRNRDGSSDAGALAIAEAIGVGIVRQDGLPAKNLLGIPWRVAFALQDDGWTLRNAIVWAKPNAMPESVTDRLSTRYELVFLLTKARRYWFDLDAIREPHRGPWKSPGGGNPSVATGPQDRNGGSQWDRTREQREATVRHPLGANPGDVWTIPTAPFAEAHFAVMPLTLAERCIQAGCPLEVCAKCGEPRRRTTGERRLDMSRPQARRAQELADHHGLTDAHIAAIRSAGATDAGKAMVTQTGTGKNTDEVQRLAAEAKTALGGYYREFLLARAESNGWSDCGCGAGFRPGVVLDPYSGSGTTGLAALRHARRYVGIDLNADYLDLSLRTRLRQGALIPDTEATA